MQPPRMNLYMIEYENLKHFYLEKPNLGSHTLEINKNNFITQIYADRL